MTWVFTIYALFLWSGCWLVMRKSKTAVNPISCYAAMYGLKTIIAPILLLQLGLLDLHLYSLDDMTHVVALSAVNFAFVALAFLVNWSPFRPFLRWLTPKTVLRVTPTTYVFNACQFAIAFSLLMLVSGAGTLWFTSPRVAYQSHREGAGVLWALCHASLMVAFACALFIKKRNAAGVFGLCFLFCFFAYFLGSKSMMLAYFVLGTFYIHFHVMPISKRVAAAICSILAIGVLGLQVLQGTASSILETLEYFDYFNNTSMFISDFGKLFQPAWGSAAVSGLWSFVPRALYPAKPLVYGISSIMAAYYPDAAEVGSTPGMLLWTVDYWDFGVVGIAIGAFVTGSLGRAAFDLFRRRQDVWTFLLLGQMAFLYETFVFYSAPFVLFILWLIAQYACLRLFSIPLIPPKLSPLRATPAS